MTCSQVPNSPSWFTRALVEENFQYFALSLLWLVSKPVGSELLPPVAYRPPIERGA